MDRASIWNGRGPWREPDRKDVAKPPAYNGDISKWLGGGRAFKRYLKKFDARWAELLGCVEEFNGAAVAADHEAAWARELWPGDTDTWKSQLVQFLNNFLTGSSRRGGA